MSRNFALFVFGLIPVFLVYGLSNVSKTQSAASFARCYPAWPSLIFWKGRGEDRLAETHIPDGSSNLFLSRGEDPTLQGAPTQIKACENNVAGAEC